MSTLDVVLKPWGKYEVLTEASGYKVKRITVICNGRLSLQLHNQRSEHWVVVSGEAAVTIGERKLIILKDQSIYIPIKTKHRVENNNYEDLVLIEVQSGNNLEEDDIIRFEDIYGRT